MASEAGELLAASEGSDAAADYLADSAAAVYGSAFDPRGWVLAEQGLRHVGTRRELTWAGLAALDLLQRQANDPTYPGFPVDAPERHEISRIALANLPSLLQRGAVYLTMALSPGLVFKSREDAIARASMSHHVMAFVAGEYARAFSCLCPHSLITRGPAARVTDFCSPGSSKSSPRMPRRTAG